MKEATGGGSRHWTASANGIQTATEVKAIRKTHIEIDKQV